MKTLLLDSNFKTLKDEYNFGSSTYKHLKNNECIQFRIHQVTEEVKDDLELIKDVKIMDESSIYSANVNKISVFNKQPNIAIHLDLISKFVSRNTTYDFQNMCLKIKE